MVSERARVLLLLLVAAAGCGEAPAEPDGAWVGAWAAAPSDSGPTYADQSLRLILTPLRGGDTARVRLSNRFGAGPLTFERALLGRQASGADLVPGSNVALSFAGARRVTVPAGDEIVSDPVPFSFEAFERLAVSVFVPAPGGATRHFAARQTSYVAAPGAGDVAASASAATECCGRECSPSPGPRWSHASSATCSGGDSQRRARRWLRRLRRRGARPRRPLTSRTPVRRRRRSPSLAFGVRADGRGRGSLPSPRRYARRTLRGREGLVL